MVDRTNIQSLIAKGTTGSLFTILLFRIDDPRLVRGFLARWLANTPGGRPAALARPVLHFAFSWRGLKKLLEDSADLDVGAPEFEFFFTEPNHFPDGLAMANSLGFAGINSPDGWWKSRSGSGFTTSDIDFALHGSFETEAEQAASLDEVRRSAAGAGLTELQIDTFNNRALSGYRPDGGILHFGYRDGITQPDIDWDDASTHGKVNFREFIVGYPNNDYEISPTRPGKWQDFAKDGSFACLTWLYQDVAKFNQFLRDSADAARPYAGSADPKEWVAAKLLGRWRNGAPLAHSPDTPPVNPSEDDLRKPFDFTDDPDGLRCPLTAHIRVVNPREQALGEANETRFPAGLPKLLRRGFSYGPRLESEADDGQDRGLIGFFFCARVNQQFYTILRWMQKTDFSDIFFRTPNTPHSQDALTGSRSGFGTTTNLPIPHPTRAPLSLSLANFIQYRGVAVFFAPSLSSLRLLAGE